jgi:CxxC motif-containing protein (DUF1111 family)
MIEFGVINVLGMLRTDTLYDPKSPKILQHAECSKGQPCIEVKLELSSFYSRLVGNDVALVRQVFGTEPEDSDHLYGGYVITEGNTYGPQMPWYMAHYCDSWQSTKDVQDPVCYADYFSPMNAAFNAAGLDKTHWPDSVAWSVYPSAPKKDNHCQPGLTTCTMVLAGFNFNRDLRPNLKDPQFQYQKYNEFLFTWFNQALAFFKDDFSEAQRAHHFPWNGAGVSWETFLYPQGMQNPFLGEYDAGPTGEKAFAAGCDVTLTGPVPGVDPCNMTDTQRGKPYAYPRQCALADLAAENAAKLRNCGLNYELHHNGWKDQWPKSYWNSAWMDANQYGRTSFLFAGVPGMQMPVTFFKDPAIAGGLSIYQQVHNASIFSLYLPIANEADINRAFPGRNYNDKQFFHTLLMSNHMESDPQQFAEGIRGKVMWHNEYRTQQMYDDPGRYPAKTFAAAFDPDTAPAPFHNNTCDGCHVRNGSGVPINTANMLDAALTKEFMKAEPYNPYPVKDYTFTGRIRPMKLVFFDLDRDAARSDASVYAEPKSFSAAIIANGRKTMGPADNFYYNNKIMNFYGDSFHVTAQDTYAWSYVEAAADQLVVKDVRKNKELNDKTYTLWQVELGSFQTNPNCSLVENSRTTKPWPKTCAEVNGDAIKAAIKDGKIGFMLLNGKRLGNASAIEAMPNTAIKKFRADQERKLVDPRLAGEIVYNAASRDGVMDEKRRKLFPCRKKPDDCAIGRFGWLGDRASLEDQVANAAFVEMNMTTSKGYAKLYPTDNVTFPIRYNYPNCGPANKTCVESKGNKDLTEQDVERLADYARWVGNPTRSEFTVGLPDVVAGEKLFRDRLHCDTCHVIEKIDIKPDDTMVSKPFRDRMAKQLPFLSYIGTDLLMHDMGYLSQVAPTDKIIRDADGVVLEKYGNYVRKIRTPALKGMRFNRFVTEAHKNTKTDKDPACDFLMHDGRACDAIEAAFLHDGPAIKKLGVIRELNNLGKDELRQLRAFLYSL